VTTLLVIDAGDQGGEEATPEQFKLATAYDNLDGSRYISTKRGSDSHWWSIGEAPDLLYKTLPIRNAMTLLSCG
jgi:hypothetical protein